jgi:hypothetical protein
VLNTNQFSDVQRRQQELWREAELRRLARRVRRPQLAETATRRSTLRLRALLAR